MEHIRLASVELDGTRVVYHFDTHGENVERLFTSRELWIDYGTDISQVPLSILTVPFVSVMLPAVWLIDAVLWISDLDRTFYESCFSLRRAYADLYRKCSLQGRIVCSRLTDNVIDWNKDAVLLFSGGLDAHTSYIRNQREVRCLVNIQGWFVNPGECSESAAADKNDCSLFAERHDKLFDYIESNFATLISNKHLHKFIKNTGDSLWHGFQHSMAFISISIPICYLHGYNRIIIASSFTVGDERVCASYPTTDVEFRFAGCGHTIHDGFELSRQDKIKLLVRHQQVTGKPYPIRVCSFNDRNCCYCEKCFRTIMGLVAENADITDFGFKVDKPLLEYYQKYFGNFNNMALFGVHNESISHWPHIKKRMIENYAQITRNRDLVDWFLNFDFRKAKRKALWGYYTANFFSIIRRKIRNIIHA